MNLLIEHFKKDMESLKYNIINVPKKCTDHEPPHGGVCKNRSRIRQCTGIAYSLRRVTIIKI